MKTTDKRKREILESLRGGLVVSCQVQPEDPIYAAASISDTICVDSSTILSLA